MPYFQRDDRVKDAQTERDLVAEYLANGGNLDVIKSGKSGIKQQKKAQTLQQKIEKQYQGFNKL